MDLENKLRIEDEEIAQIREECLRMLVSYNEFTYEMAQHAMRNGDAKISLEDVKIILTSSIAETDRRVEKLEELKRKKLEFLLSGTEK